MAHQKPNMGREMKKRKILYISGTRADYGLMRQTLFCIKEHTGLEMEIAATGMHLMPEFGMTINEIKKDGFKIHEIDAVYKKDDRESMANFIGGFIQLLTRKTKEIKPDIILLLGDRGEMLAGAIVGVYLGIPAAHIHGGDVTSTVDEIIRHSITKLSHIHFAVTKKSAERIAGMGEDPWRIFIVGAPGLDDILNEKLFSKEEIARKYDLDLSKPILLVIQHPADDQAKDCASQITETMEAIKELGYQTIVIYPNADAGGREMIRIIEEYREYNFIQLYKSLSHVDYLSLMNVAGVLIGNTSSGIIEASSFFLPVVNIGSRQEGRERAENVLDVDYNREEIITAAKKALYDDGFKKMVKDCKNPYGDGRAGRRIASILNEIEIDNRLLQKKIIY